MKRLGLAVLLAMASVLGLAIPAYANAEPVEMTNALHDIQIFKDLLVTGDFLAIVPYDIPFTTIPDEPINQTFIFSMWDGATQNGTALAYPYHDKGYGTGIVSFYFPTGTTWEYAYTFRVQENPTYYPAALYWDFTIGASNYASDSDQAAALRAKILDIGADLSTDYTIDLLTTAEGQTVLSTYGELYFLNAVPGIQSMAPTLFYLQMRSPDYTKRSWTYTLAQSMQTRYSGTFIGDFMTGSAGMFSADTSPVMNVLSVILFAALIFISTKWFKGTTLSAFEDGYALLLLLMLLGMFNMVLAGLVAFAGLAIGGVILFLNRS